jgi:CBS-domain-containing membrane protein
MRFKLTHHKFVTAPLLSMASSIEQEFFRIEREDRWLAAAINGVIAGLAVGLVAWLAEESEPLLFACLGSSAAAVVFAPLAKVNSLRSILASYVAAALISLALIPVRKTAALPLPFECFLAVTLCVFSMRMLDALHPSAIGSAMAFIIYERNAQSLLMLILLILALLTVVKVLAYVYLEELRFKDFHREFRRDYYGRELLLTVQPESQRPLQVSSDEEGLVVGESESRESRE